MKLPHGDKAVIPPEKLSEYLLNADHPQQPGHAILFRSLLGVTPDRAEKLRRALLNAAANRPAAPGRPSPYGDKYEVTFRMSGPRGE